MGLINEIKVRCKIGDPSVEGKIASFVNKALNRQFKGHEYLDVSEELQLIAVDTVKRMRTHLRVAATLEWVESFGLLCIYLHRPGANPKAKAPKPQPETQEKLEEKIEEVPRKIPTIQEPEQTDEEIGEIKFLEYDDEDLPHAKRYYPIKSKKKDEIRWGRTPGAVRSWRRRTRGR